MASRFNGDVTNRLLESALAELDKVGVSRSSITVMAVPGAFELPLGAMALAFSLEAVAILVLFAFIDNPAMFVVLTGLVFFGWGEIFSLFPSTLTDTFGPKFAATNYGFLYIAQGVGSILGGPAAAFLKQSTGSWTTVFVLVACLDALTALLAITVLKKMRRRHFEATN